MPIRSITLTAILAIGAVAAAIGLRLAADDESAPAASIPHTSAPEADEAPTSAPTSIVPSMPTSTTFPAAPTTTLAPGTTVCDRYSIIETIGTIENPELTEISGIAAGRVNPGVLWVHNDSQDGPFVYAVDPSGADLATYALDGALAFDWEDMAAGPGPVEGVSYLYVGDIGDNFEIRNGSVTVYRVEEPAISGGDGVLAPAVTLDLRYPEGSPNAEALFVDPVDAGLYIVTRDPDTTRVYRADGTADGGEQLLEPIASLDLEHHVTAADITADGSLIALRGEAQVWLFSRPPGASIAETLAGEPCSAPSPDEIQGEALAMLTDGRYVTVSEDVASPIQQVR